MTATIEQTAGTGESASDPALPPTFVDLPPDLPPPGSRDYDVPPPLRPWRHEDKVTGWTITALVTAIAAFTRFFGVNLPSGKQFDEVYYATEAQELLRYGYENNPDFMFIVHPSVGKWAIALTSYVWGNNSVGWRIAPALAGTLSVYLIIRTARRMFRSNLLGGLAGLLLTMDGISLVQSRVALLDIFLQFFILAGFAALVADRDQFRARLARFIAEGGDARTYVPRMGPRPWRILAGVMFGLSLGVKWSAAFFVFLFVLMALTWDRGALKAAGSRSAWSDAVRLSVPGAFGSLTISPLVVYLLTWLGWWAGENSWNRHWADTNSINGLGWLPRGLQSLIWYHDRAYAFHTNLTSFHQYKSTAWSWLILGRPVPYSFYGTPDGVDDHATCGASKCASEVLLIGTPLMYWAFTPIMIWLLWHWATTRDWRAASVIVAFVAGWVVWLDHPERTAFLFYMTPLMPYLVLGMTLALGTLIGAPRVPSLRMMRYRPNWRVIVAGLYVAVVIADFAWMWPIFTNVMLTDGQWHARIWFQSWI